jgi:hypothetical protein
MSLIFSTSFEVSFSVSCFVFELVVRQPSHWVTIVPTCVKDLSFRMHILVRDFHSVCYNVDYCSKCYMFIFVQMMMNW